MLQLADTHCHLDAAAFDADRDEVIRRAEESGVIRILAVGEDLASSRRAVALADRYPAVYAAVGVHPNNLTGWGSAALTELRELARRPRVVAIGEIGLDHYRQATPAELQTAALRAQLDLAAEAGLPVSLHTRQALPEMLDELAAWAGRLAESDSPLAARPGVLHAFEGTLEDARRAMQMGFAIGMGGPVTFTKAVQQSAVGAALPLEGLLLETDAPVLAPHPHRGRRNEPAYLRLTAEKIAALQSRPLADVASITFSNAARIFLWGDGD